MQPRDLIAIARATANQQATRKPRQSDLEHALTTAYYAMFHAMCRNCVDCLIGTSTTRVSECMGDLLQSNENIWTRAPETACL